MNQKGAQTGAISPKAACLSIFSLSDALSSKSVTNSLFSILPHLKHVVLYKISREKYLAPYLIHSC